VDQRNGRYSASFKLNQPGNHQIMVKLKGKDIKGSPLTVMCLKTRDVREIGPEIKLSFGTSGSGNDQFNSPNGIAINSKGYFVIADAGNNRIAVSFDYLKPFITLFLFYFIILLLFYFFIFYYFIILYFIFYIFLLFFHYF